MPEQRDNQFAHSSRAVVRPCPPDGSSILREISEQFAHRLEVAYAPATALRTQLDLNHYIAACGGQDPTDTDVFIEYIRNLGADLALNTILRKVSSLHRIFYLCQTPDPTDSISAKLAIRELKRTMTSRSKAKKPLRYRMLNEIIMTLGNKMIDARDRALLLTAYDTLARRGELSHLDYSDVDWDGKNGGAVIAVRESKSVSRVRHAWVTQRTKCALHDWTSTASIRQGRLFRGVIGGSGCFRVTSRLTGHAINARIKQLLRRACLPDTEMSSHSTRMGAATDMAEYGISLVAIQLAGGWKSPAMPARYAREFLPHRAGIGQLEAMRESKTVSALAEQ